MIKIIIYIFSVCTFMCMEVLELFIKYQHQVSSLRSHLLWSWCLFVCLFFETKSHWDRGLIDHVHVPSTEVTILCHYTRLFTWVVRIKLRSLSMRCRHLTDPSYLSSTSTMPSIFYRASLSSRIWVLREYEQLTLGNGFSASKEELCM